MKRRSWLDMTVHHEDTKATKNIKIIMDLRALGGFVSHKPVEQRPKLKSEPEPEPQLELPLLVARGVRELIRVAGNRIRRRRVAQGIRRDRCRDVRQLFRVEQVLQLRD